MRQLRARYRPVKSTSCAAGRHERSRTTRLPPRTDRLGARSGRVNETVARCPGAIRSVRRTGPNPSNTASRSCSPSGSSASSNRPSRPVVATRSAAPLTLTVTPASGTPVALLTIPVMAPDASNVRPFSPPASVHLPARRPTRLQRTPQRSGRFSVAWAYMDRRSSESIDISPLRSFSFAFSWTRRGPGRARVNVE